MLVSVWRTGHDVFSRFEMSVEADGCLVLAKQALEDVLLSYERG